VYVLVCVPVRALGEAAGGRPPTATTPPDATPESRSRATDARERTPKSLSARFRAGLLAEGRPGDPQPRDQRQGKDTKVTFRAVPGTPTSVGVCMYLYVSR